MVMVYIVFLNASILGDGFKLAADDPGRIALSAGTALIAGIMTIAMGAWANYPFALAAGLGINAIVAFSLTGRGLDAAGAMGVIVLEGIAVTVLVLVGFREAVMNAVPLALKRAIGAGIGLFILFIGFANGGLSYRLLAVRAAPGLRRHARDRVVPDDRGPVHLPVRPCDHDRPVGAQDQGSSGHLDPRHDARRAGGRRDQDPGQHVADAELLDARRSST